MPSDRLDRSPVGELTEDTVELPAGELRLLRPVDGVELADDREVEWAPAVPYWSVMWRSGLALAQDLADRPLHRLRVLELGCGMGIPSLAASRAGAQVLATDASPEAVELVALNAEYNGLAVEVAQVDWAEPAELLRYAPFDLALASDVLYERASVGVLLALLPRLAARVLLADPGRPAAAAFLAAAGQRWEVTTRTRGVVGIHELVGRLPPPAARSPQA